MTERSFESTGERAGWGEKTLPLGNLVEFSKQANYFDELADHDLERLADDIKRNGLRDKIQVVRRRNDAGRWEYVIISGHQRRRALQRLGETHTTVIVRRDLDDAGDAAVEYAFLEANQNRRHLDNLAKARVALRQLAIERGRESVSSDDSEARDRVGKILGMSGRNLSRYIRLLQAPVEVQNAFRAGQLKLVTAEQVGGLGEWDRRKIADRIRNGEDVRAVVECYVQVPDGRHKSLNSALTAFIRSIERGLEDLGGHDLKRIPVWVAEHKDVLEQAKRLLTILITRPKGESLLSMLRAAADTATGSHDAD